MKKLANLISSGSGTNLQKIIDGRKLAEIRELELKAKIARTVISLMENIVTKFEVV